VKKEIRKIALKTVLAAAAANDRQSEGGRMKPEKKEKAASSDGQRLVQAIAAGVGPAIAKAVTESLQPFVSVLKRQQASITSIAASVEEAKALSLEASHHEDDDVEEEVDELAAKAEEEMAADSEDDDEADSKKKKKDEEDDDDDEDLDAALEDLEDDTAGEDKPGELNKDFENMGDKTTRTGKIGKPKHMKELVKASSTRSIQASSVIRELYASHRALRKKYRTLKANADNRLGTLQNQVDALEAQAEQYAEKTDRRSVSAELGNFLSKNNVDVRELKAEGKKLSVEEVDQIFANAPVELDPTTRMWFKNQLTAAELMDQGEIHRGVN